MFVPVPNTLTFLRWRLSCFSQMAGSRKTFVLSISEQLSLSKAIHPHSCMFLGPDTKKIRNRVVMKMGWSSNPPDMKSPYGAGIAHRRFQINGQDLWCPRLLYRDCLKQEGTHLFEITPDEMPGLDFIPTRFGVRLTCAEAMTLSSGV